MDGISWKSTVRKGNRYSGFLLCFSGRYWRKLSYKTYFHFISLWSLHHFPSLQFTLDIFHHLPIIVIVVYNLNSNYLYSNYFFDMKGEILAWAALSTILLWRNIPYSRRSLSQNSRAPVWPAGSPRFLTTWKTTTAPVRKTSHTVVISNRALSLRS